MKLGANKSMYDNATVIAKVLTDEWMPVAIMSFVFIVFDAAINRYQFATGFPRHGSCDWGSLATGTSSRQSQRYDLNLIRFPCHLVRCAKLAVAVYIYHRCVQARLAAFRPFTGLTVF